MKYCKGMITLYDWDYKVLVSGNYENKNEAIMLVKNWSERYTSQAHHFIIQPFTKEGEIEKQNKLITQKRNQMAYANRCMRESPVVEDKKEAIVRPKAEYSNHTPFGLADEVRQVPNLSKPYAKKKKKNPEIKDNPF